MKRENKINMIFTLITMVYISIVFLLVFLLQNEIIILGLVAIPVSWPLFASFYNDFNVQGAENKMKEITFLKKENNSLSIQLEKKIKRVEELKMHEEKQGEYK